jgi:biotin carboxyl carrier protein
MTLEDSEQRKRGRNVARHEVESEVTGNVWKVLLEAGADVAEGDVIMILESMKMEIPVEAPVSGKLVDVLVVPEDQVEEEQVVAVVED